MPFFTSRTFLAHGQLVPCQDPPGLQCKAAFQPAGPWLELLLRESPSLNPMSRNDADPSLRADEAEGHEASGPREEPATLLLFTLRLCRLLASSCCESPVDAVVASSFPAAAGTLVFLKGLPGVPQQCQEKFPEDRQHLKAQPETTA